MEVRIANPKALGFIALGIVAWMESMLGAGWFSNPPENIMRGFLTFGALALLIVALASFLRNETWHAVFFMFWAAVTHDLLSNVGTANGGPNAFGGWYQILLALALLFFFLAALRIAAGSPTVILALALTVVFACLGVASWTGVRVLAIIGSYVGLVAALAAFWAAWGALGDLGGGGGASSTT